MSLLHIAEPANASANTPGKSSQALGLGIDLGTTNSLAALRRSDGSMELISNPQGGTIIPSQVAYELQGMVCVGNIAASRAGQPGWTVFRSIKRYMGLAVEQLGDDCPYQLASSSGLVKFAVDDRQLTPQQISAVLLRHLYMAARHEANIGKVVVTVPAYFDDAQRQATRDAARLAGLPLARLLNEPTAAALAYGLEKDRDGYIGVFDLGGGTFDISVLKSSEELMQVLVTSGDTRLGGDDFDQRLLSLAETSLGLRLSTSQRHGLLPEARRAKEALSQAAKTTLDMGDGALAQISREAFVEATHGLCQRCLQLTAAAIDDAGLKPRQLRHLVLVGGATRMPMLVAMLRRAFPETEIYNSLDPDTTVAIGAAQLASQLGGGTGSRTLVDVIPLSLGIETMGGLTEKIIPRNTPIPVTREQRFTTARDGQTNFLLHLVQGERELVSDCRSLARFTLEGIPPMPAGAAQLQVSFAIDANGMLEVSAREERSGASQHIVVEPSAGLSHQQIADMLQASYANAAVDMQSRQLHEARLEAQQLLHASRAALDKDGELLKSDERAGIEAAMAGLQALLASGQSQPEQLQQASAGLAEATDSFAQRRMTKALKASLQNRKLSDFDST